MPDSQGSNILGSYSNRSGSALNPLATMKTNNFDPMDSCRDQANALKQLRDSYLGVNNN